jgi:hypothetical protein
LRLQRRPWHRAAGVGFWLWTECKSWTSRRLLGFSFITLSNFQKANTAMPKRREREGWWVSIHHCRALSRSRKARGDSMHLGDPSSSSSPKRDSLFITSVVSIIKADNPLLESLERTYKQRAEYGRHPVTIPELDCTCSNQLSVFQRPWIPFTWSDN